jgi:hypothetical protein
MRAIFGLIAKDLMIMRRYFIFLAGYLVLISFILGGGTVFSCMAVGVAALMLTSMAFAFDERGRSAQLIASFPVRRAHVPLARYLEVLLFVGVGFAIFAFLGFLWSLVRSLPLNAMKAGSVEVPGVVLVAMGAGFLLALAGVMPLWYRFGYAKTRILNVAFFALMFIPGSIAGNMGRWQPGLEAFAELEKIPLAPFLAGAVGLTLAALGISCWISMRIYARKEF